MRRWAEAPHARKGRSRASSTLLRVALGHFAGPSGRGRWFQPSEPTDTHPLSASWKLARSFGSPRQTVPTLRPLLPKGTSSAHGRGFFGERGGRFRRTSPHSPLSARIGPQPNAHAPAMMRMWRSQAASEMKLMGVCWKFGVGLAPGPRQGPHQVGGVSSVEVC